MAIYRQLIRMRIDCGEWCSVYYGAGRNSAQRSHFSRRCWTHGQSRDLPADSCLRNAEIVGGLQIQPKLRAAAKPVAEAQRGVAGNRPFARDDLADSVRRYRELSCELG